MRVCGVNGWGGPADGFHALAVAMGFESIDHAGAEAPALIRAIQQGGSLPVRDWTRALVATEFAFVSVVLGKGADEVVHRQRGIRGSGSVSCGDSSASVRGTRRLPALSASPGDPRSPTLDGAVAHAEPNGGSGQP
jgi:hypothetical protein